MRIAGDKYRIIGKIGSGGMGDVYLGEVMGSHGFKRKIAIKMLPRHMAEDSFTRDSFINEASILSDIFHPNLVKVFDFGIWDNRLYLCLEYIEGCSLRKLLNNVREWGEVLPLEITVKIFVKIFEGITYMHEKMILHGDLSPKNILVGVNGEVKILDFGLSKAMRDRRENPALGGKEGYLAPEIMYEKKMYPASDIYSAGIVLGELIEGIVTVEDRDGTVEMIEGIVGRCLEEDPERRPDARQLLEELRTLRRLVDSGLEIDEYLRQVEGDEGDTLIAESPVYKEDVNRKKSKKRDLSLFAIAVAAAGLLIFLSRGSGLKMEGSTIEQKMADRPGPVAAVPGKQGSARVDSAPRKKALSHGNSRRKSGDRKKSDNAPVKEIQHFVTVRSSPEGAKVYAGGRIVGVTPARIPVIMRGEGAQKGLRISMKGYKDVVISDIEEDPSTSKDHFFVLERLKGQISVNVNPWAYVSIDGRMIGTTPVIEHEISSGEHILMLENKELGVRVEKRVTIDPNGNQKIVEDFMSERALR